MFKSLGLALCALLVFAGTIQAAIINVTVSADQTTIFVGQTATLSVYAQVDPRWGSLNAGVLEWNVDVRNGNPSVVDLLSATVDQSGWTLNGVGEWLRRNRWGPPPRHGFDWLRELSGHRSSGTETPWGVEGISAAGLPQANPGLTSPVKLFSIQFEGLSPGTSTISVEPDPEPRPADTLIRWPDQPTWGYSPAHIDITVLPLVIAVVPLVGGSPPPPVPEPATVVVLAVGGLALLRRRQMKGSLS